MNRICRQILAAAGFAAMASAHAVPAQAQGRVFVTPYEYVVGGAARSGGQAVAAAAISRGQAAQFNRELAAARAALKKCKKQCRSQADTLARLLARKDRHYLEMGQMRSMMGSMFGEAGAARMDAMDLVMHGEQGYDGGIPRECSTNFANWARQHYAAFNVEPGMGGMFEGLAKILPPGNPLSQEGYGRKRTVTVGEAYEAARPYYEPYRACRDRVEARRLAG